MKQKETTFSRPMVVLLLASLATFLWGSAVPCIKIGYQMFGIKTGDTGGQMLFAGYRFMFAGVAIIIVLSIKNHKIYAPPKEQWMRLAALGFVQTFLQYFFYYIGMANVTGVKGSIMNASSTLFCVILAHFYYQNDKLSIKKGLGCLIGFAGVVLINLSKGSINGEIRLVGEGFLLITAIVVAVGTLMNKEIAKLIPPTMAAGYQLLIGGIGLVVLGYFLKGNIETVTIGGVLLFVYMILISSVAFSIWSILLKYNSMGKVSIYKFLIPVFGTLLSIVLLKETAWDIHIFAALICVCVGIYFVNK